MKEIRNQDKTYKRPGAGTIIGGVVAGSIVKQIVLVPHQLVASKNLSKMLGLSKSLTSDEFKTVDDAIKETLKTSGLAQKGVGIIKATSENVDEISKILSKEIDNNIITKFTTKNYKKKVLNFSHSMLGRGKSAVYVPKSKKIIMPEKELSLAAFHEAGHAANSNFSTIGKVLQKGRGFGLLAVPIALISLWKTKKAPNQEPKSKTDKTTTFIKENAGKLTFASFLPILLEEGMASFKGNNFAKKVLSPELAKKVSKTNALGFSTYVGLAAFSSLGTYFGVKVKDAIAKPELVEQKK